MGQASVAGMGAVLTAEETGRNADSQIYLMEAL